MGIDVPLRTGYLGILAADPASADLVSGQWWYNSTELNWKFYNGDVTILFGGTFTKERHILGSEFGRPNTNPPGIVDQDNLTLLSFTVNTDKLTYEFDVPDDYAEGPIDFHVEWTNDGGADDDGKNVKWQIDYQVGNVGDAISGSHANSPKTVEDTYASVLGWILHHTAVMSIGAADFDGKHAIYLKVSAVTAPATALSCEPHLTSLHMTYKAKREVD